MRSLVLLAMLMIALCAAATAQPTIQWTVFPMVIGGTGSSPVVEGPAAYYIQISGLAPNAAYSQLHFGYNHISAPTTTRGSKWVPGSGWISPSTARPWRTSDASGVIKAWFHLRTPSSYSFVDSSRVRVRISRFGVDTSTFDSPFSITNLQYDTTSAGTGAVVYGYMDTTTQNNPGQYMLAYGKEGDPQPFACYFLMPNAAVLATADSQLYTTRTDPTLRRAGYFQFLVPANAKISRLEVRDSNNVLLRSKTSTLWTSGAPGTMTNLGTLDPLVMSVLERTNELPAGFALRQNYPNPFNPSTTVTFELPVAGQVRLTVVDMLGREVAVLVNEQVSPGTYTTTWNAAGLASGPYLLRLQSAGFSASRRMMLLK